MVTFIIAVVLLVLGYWIYSKVIERVIGVNPKRVTPAVAHPDGVDYVPMKPWRIFLIQFLNIAGVGPICGAIMGAQFGTASFLWIVFGQRGTVMPQTNEARNKVVHRTGKDAAENNPQK